MSAARRRRKLTKSRASRGRREPAGAGGILGTDTVARSAPDGYTLVLMDPAIVINPTLQADVPYDLFKNLQTVSIVSSSPEVLVVALSLPVKSVSELIAYGKANPGKLNFASAGIGTTPHLAAEMFKLRTGIEATHIPYKGIGASYTDLMTGKVQMAFSSIAGALRSPTITGCGRSPPPAPSGAASIRTCRPSPRLAFRDSRSTCGWACSPRQTAAPVLRALNGELIKALRRCRSQGGVGKVGVEPRGTSPEEGRLPARRVRQVEAGHYRREDQRELIVDRADGRRAYAGISCVRGT
jgi:hypothetical protein